MQIVRHTGHSRKLSSSSFISSSTVVVAVDFLTVGGWACRVCSLHLINISLRFAPIGVFQVQPDLLQGILVLHRTATMAAPSGCNFVISCYKVYLEVK